MPSRLTGIVLQGGGALGAYEHGVLKALYDVRPGFEPAVVTGVSIGAINAAAVAAGKGGAMDALDHLWKEHLPAPEIPFISGVVESALGAYLGSGMFRAHPESWVAPWLAPWTRPGWLSPDPLRRTLEEVLDLHALAAGSGPWLAVTAVDAQTGKPLVFDSREPPRVDLDVVLASASLPVVFEPQKVAKRDGYDGGYCYDGGLISNTPFSEAINRLERLAAESPEAELELVVVELFPHQARLPRDVAEAADRSLELILAAKHHLEDKLVEKVSLLIDLVEEVKALEGGQALFASGKYASFEAHRRIQVKRVVYTEDESAGGPLDFSREQLERRFAAGYRAGKQSLA